MTFVLADTLSYTTVGWDHNHMDMGVIPMIIFWALLIALAVWIFRTTRRGRDDRETPSQILSRRFAQGAISAQEFERRRSLIGADQHQKPSNAPAGHAPIA